MIPPRYELIPPGRGVQRAEVVIELAAATGQPLDTWQQRVIRGGCKTTGARKRWAATEVGLNVPRQNGKGSILQSVELAHALEFGSKLIVHSAHEFKTSTEAFIRMEEAIEEAGLQHELFEGPRRGSGGVTRGHGEEGYKFKNRARIRYSTRTRSAGRGLTGDLIVLDEAMILPEVSLRALFMTISGRTIHGNPQVWYAGSAVDQLAQDHGVVFARVRKRGLEGSPGLAYFEWSAGELEDLDEFIDDPQAWKRANPAIGIRIAEDHVRQERESLDARSFAVERLGAGDWPPTDQLDDSAIDLERWLALEDQHSYLVDPIVLAFDVTPDRSRATIAAAGRRPDGRFHVEKVDAARGTGWLPQRLSDLVERHNPEAVIFDPASPAAALIKPLDTLGVPLEKITAQEYAAACGLIFDLIEQGGLRHLGQHELTAAVRNASKRPLGEAWAWSRRLSAGDISPLVAGTLALWRAHASSESVYESRGLVAV